MTAAAPDAVVVDTMVVSALMNSVRRPEPAARYWPLIAERRIVVSFVTVTEMRYGALKAGWGEFRRRVLDRDLARLTIVEPDNDVMNACARLRADGERAGHPLGQKIHEADRWIAATAIHLGIELASDDASFQDVTGLTVISTTEPS